MSTAWVLIVIVSSYGYGGGHTQTQPFVTQEACELAAEWANEKQKENSSVRIFAKCFKTL